MAGLNPCANCEYNELMDIIDPEQSEIDAQAQAEGCETFINTVKSVYNIEIGCGMAAAALMKATGDENTHGLAMATMEQIVARQKLPKAELPILDESDLITKQDVLWAWRHEYQAGAILGNMKRIARSGKLPLVEGITEKGFVGITRESAKKVLEIISAPGYEGPGVGVETRSVLQRLVARMDEEQL